MEIHKDIDRLIHSYPLRKKSALALLNYEQKYILNNSSNIPLHAISSNKLFTKVEQYQNKTVILSLHVPIVIFTVTVAKEINLFLVSSQIPLGKLETIVSLYFLINTAKF